MHVGSCLFKSLTDSCVMAEVTKVVEKNLLVSFSCWREQQSSSSTISCQQRGGRVGSAAAAVVAYLVCVADDVLNGILNTSELLTWLLLDTGVTKLQLTLYKTQRQVPMFPTDRTLRRHAAARTHALVCQLVHTTPLNFGLKQA